jgi:hypothetical protein
VVEVRPIGVNRSGRQVRVLLVGLAENELTGPLLPSLLRVQWASHMGTMGMSATPMLAWLNIIYRALSRYLLFIRPLRLDALRKAFRLVKRAACLLRLMSPRGKMRRFPVPKPRRQIILRFALCTEPRLCSIFKCRHAKSIIHIVIVTILLCLLVVFAEPFVHSSLLPATHYLIIRD